MHYLFLGIILFCSSILADTDTDEKKGKKLPGIKSFMTAEEILATGLNKLTENEISALNAWLLRYTANEAPIMRSKVAEVKEEANKDIVSQIDGEFRGWKDKTVFRLQNGQVWQQRNRGRWKTRLMNPKVVISRNFLGFYEMKISGHKRAVGVKRLR